MENIDEKLVKDLKDKIATIPASVTSVEDLRTIAEPLSDILCNYFNYFGEKEEIINRIIFYLSDFIGKAITEEDFIKNLYNDTQMIINQRDYEIPIYNSGSYGSGSGSSFRSNKTGQTSTKPSNNDILDADTDLINKVSESYDEILALIDNNILSIDSAIMSVASSNCNELTNYIENAKKDLTGMLNEIKNKVLETMGNIIDVDESIEPVDLSNLDFSDIWKTTTKWVKSKPLKAADAEFFKNNGCKVENGVATFIKDNKTYAYNIKTHALTVTSNKTGSVTKSDNMAFEFFIPTGNVDYSKYNTLTAILSPKTSITESSGIVIRAGVKDSKKSISHDLIAESTRFMNGVAKTDLKNCQNAIIGGSQWGARSIDIAARNGNLYKTVYCVNNALIVNGKNGVPGGKYKIDEKVLKNLNGKNIYFISADGDDNTYKKAVGGDAWPDSNCRLENSYLYTGMEILLKECPDAQVYMLSNINNTKTLSTLSKYSNYHYNPSYWDKVMTEDYKYHNSYSRIIQDVMKSGLVGYNGYNDSTTA